MGFLDKLTNGFDTSVFSDKGGRNTNQDAYKHKVHGRLGCWVLCDGLGGHQGGEMAARIAVEECLRTFWQNPKLEPDILNSCMLKANRLVMIQRQESVNKMMSTTAVMLAIYKQQALWAHIGDSRLYYFKNGKVFRQTADHSLTYKLMQIGEIKPEEIRSHADRNRLLRVLGTDELRPEIENTIHNVESNEAFLLCTDGFWEYIYENEMETLLANMPNSQTWLSKMVEIIKQRQPKHADNYTAIAVKVR